MRTYGELVADPSRLSELEAEHILISAAGSAEVVVAESRAQPEATMVFMHETIEMMKAERADKIEKLRGQLTDSSVVIPLAKKAGSFWNHITVGRASTADIVLDDPAVSNVHAHFELEPGGAVVSLQDVGSSNGTYINREPLQPHTEVTLSSGDCVRIGQSIFYYLSRGIFEEMVRGAGG